MPKFNIDEICEPIEITVEKTTFKIVDIPRDMIVKLDEAGERMKTVDREDMKAAEKAFDDLAGLLAEVLGDDKGIVAKLGMRKLMAIVKYLMDTINDELEVKNVPEVGAAK